MTHESKLVRASDIQAEAYRRDWGKWRLDQENYVLYVEPYDNGYRYEVDLEECSTSAEVCDWIFQVHGKEWATHEIVTGLVGAFGDVLKPQANLCSLGRSLRLTKAKIRSLVRSYPADKVAEER